MEILTPEEEQEKVLRDLFAEMRISKENQKIALEQMYMLHAEVKVKRKMDSIK